MPHLLTTTLVALGCTAAALAARLVSWSGAVAGCVLAFLFMWAGGWPAFSGMAVLVVAGSAASRVGYARKRAAGVEQSDAGRRTAVHALANAGPACLFLLCTWNAGVASVAVWGALAAALSDTLSSEIGLLSRKRPRILLLGREVEAGADGGMTPLGTLAGVVTAGLFAGLAAFACDAPGWILPVLLGGVFGNLADSLLGVTLEPALPKRYGNEIVNAAASFLGGLCAWGALAAGA